MLSGTFANRNDFIFLVLSVVRSWSYELEIFNAEAQRRRVRRELGVSSQESGVSLEIRYALRCRGSGR